MPTRTGPIATDTTAIALGLAQIRIGAASAFIGQRRPILPESASIGALANTKFIGNREYFKLESGYPLLEDASYPLREAAALECAFKQITPANIALSQGLDPAGYASAHTGTIALGTVSTPAFIRMEAIYTYPDGDNTMTIIFPNAQVISSVELDWATEEPAAVPIVIESKRADGSATGGHAIWNGAPLGLILWDDGSTATTSSSTTSTTSSTTTGPP